MTVTLTHISKHYPLKTALDDISVTFDSGRIHALLGENGAGKSTLAGIISGAIRSTGGSILLDGVPAAFASPRDALGRGIVIVQQRPLLASGLTARENILLAMDAGARAGAARRSLPQALFLPRGIPPALRVLHEQWAPGLPLGAFVRDLGGNNRFYVSLLTALLKEPRLLILDEPSAFLDVDERRRLYGSLTRLAAGGTGIIVITHSTAEAETYAHTVTVLNEGRLAATYGSAEQYRLARAEKGGEHYSTALPPQPAGGIRGAAPQEAPASPTLCLRLEHASCRPKSRPALLDASLAVCYGQITAVSGLKEAAMDTLEDVVCGLERGAAAGTAVFRSRNGTAATLSLARGQLSAAFLRAHKAAIVPSDRTFRAAHPRLTVAQMLSAYIPGGTPQEAIRALIAEADVRITPEETCSNLSGGMLQRLIVARELSTAPELVILCNPMQGLDIHSQGRLSRTITALAQAGKAVLIVGAADFPLTLCHRVYALEGGATRLVFAAGVAAGVAREEAPQ